MKDITRPENLSSHEVRPEVTPPEKIGMGIGNASGTRCTAFPHNKSASFLIFKNEIGEPNSIILMGLSLVFVSDVCFEIASVV